MYRRIALSLFVIAILKRARNEKQTESYSLSVLFYFIDVKFSISFSISILIYALTERPRESARCLIFSFSPLYTMTPNRSYDFVLYRFFTSAEVCVFLLLFIVRFLCSVFACAYCYNDSHYTDRGKYDTQCDQIFTHAIFPLTKANFWYIIITGEEGSLFSPPLHRGYLLNRYSSKQPNAVSTMPTIKSIKPFRSISRMFIFGFDWLFLFFFATVSTSFLTIL